MRHHNQHPTYKYCGVLISQCTMNFYFGKWIFTFNAASVHIPEIKFQVYCRDLWACVMMVTIPGCIGLEEGNSAAVYPLLIQILKLVYKFN